MTRVRAIAVFAAFIAFASCKVDPVMAFNSSPMKRSLRSHEVAYAGASSPMDIYASPEVMISDDLNKPIRRKRLDLSKGETLRTMPRPEGLKSSRSSKGEATTTFSRTYDNTPMLLSKDEERDFTNQIRMLRTVVRIRDELVAAHKGTQWQPTEEMWADACGMNVMDLRRIMYDGQQARSKIVSANGGLVGSIAKRYFNAVTKANQANGGMGTILSFHDLVQEGNLGLMEAAERFEPERGFRFSTYATWWVRQRMLRAISDYSRIIRLPAHVHSMIRRIQKSRRDMEKEIGRQPSLPELAHYLGMSVDKLRMYTESSRTVLSLENPVRGKKNKQDETSVTLGEFISSDSPTPEEDAENRSLREVILSVVDELPRSERDVLVARFGLNDGTPNTVDETAKLLGISRDRVRVVEARALNKLRHPQRNHRLKSYVGGDVEDFSEDSVPSNLSPEQIWSF